MKSLSSTTFATAFVVLFFYRAFILEKLLIIGKCQTNNKSQYIDKTG